MSNTETMAAFGASEEACYRWPGDSVDDRLCRAAFCAGSGWSAAEIDRLQSLLNGRDNFIVSEGLWLKFVDTLPR